MNVQQVIVMSVDEFFATRQVFTHREFVEFLDAGGPRSVKTRERFLEHYTHAGRILRVRRGLYVTVSRGTTPESCPVDPLLLAGRMADDAVLAYHTALELFGRAYSVHQRFLFLTSHATRPLTFRSYAFRRVPFPKSLQAKQQEMFGVRTAERAGLDVRVTNLERTLVDVLDRPKLAGGWAEVWRSLESVEFFDLDEVVEYALLLDNATTSAKVGFYLEQHREALMVDEAHLKPLHEHRPRSPHYMERRDRTPGRLVAKWNLLVPAQVLERSWQEPL